MLIDLYIYISKTINAIYRMKIFILLSAIMLQLSLQAQTISYDIPEGYENDISKEDYKKVVDMAVSVISKRYTIDNVKEGAIQLKDGQDMQTLNLHNLVGKCTAVEDKSKWENVVKEHFDNLFMSIDEQKKIDVDKFETVEKYLAVRIYPKKTINERGGINGVVAKTDLEGTYTLLMLDLPGAFTPVPREVFEKWKKNTDDIFAIAQSHINKQTVEKAVENFDIDSSKIEICFLGNEDYAASYALDLSHNAPELVGGWGAVIAIPNKGLACICKVSKDKPVDFVKFIQATKPVIEKQYNEHQQPVSDQFFWYYKGKFTKIYVTTDDKGVIHVLSPMGLTELMLETK